MTHNERSGIDATSEADDGRNALEAITEGRTMSKRYRYAMTIETASNLSADESVRCLRAFLKNAIRSYSIKCLSVEPINHGGHAGPEEAPQSTQRPVDGI